MFDQQWGEISCQFLQPDVNFTNILWAAFSYKSFSRSFQFWFVNFWQKDFGTKAAHKMLVKLTPSGSIGPRHVLKLLFSKNNIMIINCDHNMFKVQPIQFQNVINVMSVTDNNLDQFRIFASTKYYLPKSSFSSTKCLRFLTHFNSITWSLNPTVQLGNFKAFVNTFGLNYLCK